MKSTSNSINLFTIYKISLASFVRLNLSTIKAKISTFFSSISSFEYLFTRRFYINLESQFSSLPLIKGDKKIDYH